MRLAHAATPNLQENLAYYSRIILKSTEDLLFSKLFVNNVRRPSRLESCAAAIFAATMLVCAFAQGCAVGSEATEF